MGKGNKNTLRSVRIACELLETLQQVGGAGITELANETNYSKSTIHRQMSTLLEQEYVIKKGTSYQLSLRYLDISHHVSSQIENYDVIKKEVKTLAKETGEVAQFATEEHGRIVYLYKSKGERGVETSSHIGTREYLHSTSLGKSILSQMSQDRVNEILARRGLPKKTKNTITTREALFDELEEIRERGFAFDREENVMGLHCVAAPVIEDGIILGAVSLSGPSSRIKGDRYETELPEIVTRTANIIQLNSKFS